MIRAAHFPGLAAQIIEGSMLELLYLYGKLIQAALDMVLQHTKCQRRTLSLLNSTTLVTMLNTQMICQEHNFYLFFKLFSSMSIVQCPHWYCTLKSSQLQSSLPGARGDSELKQVWRPKNDYFHHLSAPSMSFCISIFCNKTERNCDREADCINQ